MSTQRIFAFWTGDNILPDLRKRCFDSFGVTGLEPTLVTSDTLSQWIVSGRPLHPAYEFLSAVHRSDYLRAYFMHHHGGGYADIKHQTGSWLPVIEQVNNSPRLVGAGSREYRGNTVWLQNSRVEGKVYIHSWPVPTIVAKLATNVMRTLRPLTIGVSTFYFKPDTSYTRTWLREVERRLDELLPSLKVYPAQDARDRLGYPSGYPIPWSFILQDITGPLSLLYFLRLSRDIPRPLFTDYLEQDAV